MKLIIKNKLLTLKGGSTVTNDMGEDVFLVKGKPFSITKKKYICDMEGNKLFAVRNKLFGGLLHAAFIYDTNKEKIGKLQMNVSLQENYKLEKAQDNIEIKKSTEHQGLAIYKNDEVIGVILKRVSGFKDSFVVDCLKDSEAALITALVIALDNIEDNTSND